MPVNWDKLSAGLDAALVTLFAMQGRRGGGHFQNESGPPTEGGKGFFASLLALLIRVWEEKGGSMKDESEMLESLFSGPVEKSEKLTVEERRKVAAVLNTMTAVERNVFRVAIFIMNPEISMIEVEERKDDKGKVVSPASKRTEKTGVDPRINVLRGIAEMVHEDHSNAAEVAAMLRDAGTLGSDNKALAVLKKMQTETGKILCNYFDVEKVEDITKEMILKKVQRLSEMISTDPTQPRPKDDAGWLMRMARKLTPGAFPNA